MSIDYGTMVQLTRELSEAVECIDIIIGDEAYVFKEAYESSNIKDPTMDSIYRRLNRIMDYAGIMEEEIGKLIGEAQKYF